MLGLPFLTGKTFLNTKGTKVTKEKKPVEAPFPPFVYLVSFVFRLFPARYGRALMFHAPVRNQKGTFECLFVLMSEPIQNKRLCLVL